MADVDALLKAGRRWMVAPFASPYLQTPYTEALVGWGYDVRAQPETISAHGLHALARERGLIASATSGRPEIYSIRM